MENGSILAAALQARQHSLLAVEPQNQRITAPRIVAS